MAHAIQQIIGSVILVIVPATIAAAQSAGSGVDPVTITLPAEAKLSPGNYRVTVEVSGKRFPAQLNVPAPAPSRTTQGASGTDRQQNPAPPAAAAPSGSDKTTAAFDSPPQPATPWLPIALAALIPIILAGVGAWLYFKVYQPRKHLHPYEEALKLLQAGEYKKALPQLTQVESKLPDSVRPAARFFIAFAHFQLGNKAEAEHILNSLYEEDSNDTNAAYLLGYLRVEAQQYNKAEPVLTTLEKNGKLEFKQIRKLLGLTQLHRALAAIKEGNIDGAAELFAKVEALKDYADQVPSGLRNRHVALGTKALFDKETAEARRQFESLEKAAAAESEPQRAELLISAKLGLALAAWIDDTAESAAVVEKLLVEAARMLDPEGATEQPWPQEINEADIADRLEALDARAGQTAEQKQKERCLRDLHFVRGMSVLRAWDKLNGEQAHAQIEKHYKAALERFACARARDEQFSDPLLVVGLLTYYLHPPGPEHKRALDLLEMSRKRGMNVPAAMEIINNREKIEKANAGAVELYLQVLDKYLNDETVRAEVRRALLDQLGSFRRFQKLDKRPDFGRARSVEPTVAEVRHRSELLRVHVEQIISSQSQSEEIGKVRLLSDTLVQDGQRLFEQAATIEKNESELLALTGTQLFKER